MFITSTDDARGGGAPSGALRTQAFCAAMRTILKSRTQSALLLPSSFNSISLGTYKKTGELQRELVIYNIISKDILTMFMIISLVNHIN